jgi:GTP-binding protein
MMKVHTAKFLRSALKQEDYPRDRRPELAFVGRSNVGKSTLLNALLGRQGLAKTSSTPGKTQTINFFDVNGKVYLVDLPGYGYARVPKELKAQWNRVMVEYVRDREPLRMVAALVDARHDPTEQDHEMLAILDEAEVPTLVVATKIDKVKRSQRRKNLERVRRGLELEEDALVLPFSGVSKEGLKELWEVIDDCLG